MQNNKQLWLGVLGATLLIPNAAFADISGKVFRDFNANGTLDSGASFNEFGMAGITVKAFDATGVEKASAVSGADGTYTLTGLTVAADYRVEFSWAESWLKPGAGGGTSVQFAKEGASNINVAVNNPAQYCQADPLISTTHFWPLEQTTTNPTLVGFRYSNGVTAPSGAAYQLSSWQDVAPKTFGKSNELGAIFGIAWHRSQQYIYSAAMKEQYVGFGPGGRGQIYRTKINPVDGSVVSAPEQWVNVETDLGLSVCGSHDNLATAGYSDAEFDQVGKCSLGDLEISDNEQSLFVSNLTTKQIVEISTADSSKLNTFDFPLNAADCPNNTTTSIRPFGLAYHDGKLFAGAVCSAEESQNVNDIRAFVYRLDDPATQSWTRVTHFNPGIIREDRYGADSSWEPWRSAWSDAGGYYQGYESPMLSDIAFYDNNMILGLRDRTGDQIADDVIIKGTTINGVASIGDLVCTTYDSTTQLYLPETDSPNACGARIASGSGRGDKNGEFYWGDGNVSNDTHEEVTMGNLAVFGGSNLLIGGVNPGYALGSSTADSGGILWLDNETGAPLKTYYLYTGADNNNSKGNGMGDIEALCDPAPIEVGNRVWLDADADGIQDADELGIDGVDVVLICGTDTATVTTANGGQFLFSSASNATFMSAGESCKVTVNSAGQTSLDGLIVTKQNADNVTDNQATTDLRDSDATSAGEIAFTVGNVGENNHTLDIGYKSAPAVTLDFGDAPDSYKTLAATTGAQHTIVAGLNLGAVVDAETDGQPNAVANGDGVDEDGVNFMTPLAPGKRAIIGVATTQPRTSDAKLDAWIDFNGDGDFEDAGEQIATNLNIKGVTLYDLGSAVLDIEVPAAAKPGVTYARFRLSSAGGLSPSGAAPDGEVEDYAITIVSGATLGNFVWQDTNKDGVQDAGEPPVAGVQVNLIRVSDGAVVDSLFTDSNGEYLFTHVAPDTYQVAFVAPTGYSFTTAMQGSDDTKDSNADASGLTPSITLADGDDQRQWDAGLVLAENTLVHCAAVPRQPTEVNTTFTLPKFDSALGTLQTVNVSAYASTQQFVALENYAAQTQKIKITTSVDGVLILPDANIVDTTYAYNSGFKDLTVADGILDYQGTSALAFADWLYAVDSSNVTYATPADFTTANAGETIALPYETMSGYSVTGGGGNNQSFQRTFANAGACVAYVYEKKAPAVDVSLTKVANKTEVKRGDTVVYTLTVTNESDVAATGVEVTDELPAGVQYVSDDSAGAYASATGIWTVGELTAKASKTIAISVLVK